MEFPDHFLASAKSPSAHDFLASGNPSSSYMETDVPIRPPPCDCNECLSHFYSTEEQQVDRWHYTKITSNAEASSILNTFANSLAKDRATLQEKLRLHGDDILGRWKKRTQQKREDILLQADPDLMQSRWWFLRDESSATQDIRDVRRQRNRYLLPYMDTETLKSNPSVLFGLLEGRANHHPQEWVSFDCEESVCTWAHGFFDVDFNDSGVVMHGSDYGRLVPWKKGEAERCDMIGYPRARLIIEAQALLMGFLRRVVELLLENVSEKPTSFKWEEALQVGLKRSGDALKWSQYTYQPFSAPPRFNVEALVAQAKTRVDETGDHLWLLQTEPSYIRRYLARLQQAEVVEQNRGTRFEKMMMVTEIFNDIRTHWFWKDALDEFQYAQKLSNSYRDSIHPGQPLPKKFDNILGALELRLVNEMHRRSKQLQALLTQRPGFSHWFKSTKIDDGEIGNPNPSYSIEFKGGARGAKFDGDPLFWLLLQLQGPPDEQRAFRKRMLFECLEDHLTAASVSERARLDVILYEKLSDYATIHEMLTAVRFHNPKPTERDFDKIIHTDDRRAWQRQKAMASCQLPLTARMEILLGKFLSVPLPSGRKDHMWLQNLDSVHKTLQDFWQGVHDGWAAVFRPSKMPVEIMEEDLKVISHWNSAQYHEQLETKRQRILSEMNKPSTGDDDFLPLPAAFPGQKTQGFQPAEVKKKTKTRNEEAQQSELETDALAKTMEHQISLDPSLSVPLISLTKRSLALFRCMYPETLEERQKFVEWETFVISMVDAGFVAKNGGGSIVIFEDGQGEGRIVFHKPHPVPKLDPIMLQAMGRRMNKWFGWHRALFGLATK